ncbi:MAG: ATP-binding protein [Limnospira sp.]
MIKFEGSEPISVPCTVRFQTPTNLDRLADVLGWFARLQQPSIPEPVWLRCQLALAEGFTNAVRHAHRGFSSEVPIEIEVSLSPETIEMRIFDRGQPFDLEKKFREMSPETDRGATGGRGLKLMRDIADELSYRPTPDGRNCLAIVKHVDPSPQR